MKIGIDARFAVHYPRRGIGTYSLHLLHAIIKENPHYQFFLYIDQRDGVLDLPSGKNVKICYLFPTLYPIWEQVILPFAILRDGLDLFHALGNTAPLFLLNKVKLVLTLHDVMFLDRNLNIPKPKSFYQRMGRLYRSLVAPINARCASTVITVSEYSRQDILRKISRIESENVVVIYEAPDPRFLSACGDFRERKERYLLCLGAEDPRKNIFRITQAYLDALNSHNFDHDLIICGYINWEGSPAHNLVLSSNANGRVHFLPFVSVEDLIELYKNASAFLYLSLYEGFGIPLLEAFSCGCPVIASNITSIPEIGGDAAIYVDPTDISAIQLALIKVCESDSLQMKLGSRGLLRVKNFSWQETAYKTLDIYQKAMTCPVKNENFSS